jgi:hypothetical protein
MLGRIGDIFNVFRSLYLDIMATQAFVLLMIASRPGIGPYDIIDARRSARDTRAKELFLTSIGSLLMANVLREFAGVRYERPPKG